MPLIAGTCKNCGASIKFDDKLEKGVCEYCGTPFVKEDVVINNHYHNNFENATVILNDSSSIENKLENAEVYLTKLNNYEQAKKLYQFVTINKAGDYRGWWGMVRVLSKQFTFIECTQTEYDNIASYYKNAVAVATDAQKAMLKSEWIPYSKKVENFIEKQRQEINEIQRRFEESQKRKQKRDRIRLIVSVVLSLICSIFIIIYASVTDIEKYETGQSNFGLTMLIIFGTDIIMTIILGLIGSTKAISAFPAISAIAFFGILIFKIYKNIEISITIILSIILISIFSLAISFVCYIIPHAILKRLVKK